VEERLRGYVVYRPAHRLRVEITYQIFRRDVQGELALPLQWDTDRLTIFQELRELMLRYGWPDNFDREGCRDAMLEWGEEKTRKDIDEMKQRHQLALNT
jgi:hypothetical protein